MVLHTRTKPAAQALFRGSDQLKETIQETHKAPTKKNPLRPIFRLKGICKFYNTNIGSISSAKSVNVFKTLVEVSDALVSTLQTLGMGFGDKRSQK